MVPDVERTKIGKAKPRAKAGNPVAAPATEPTRQKPSAKTTVGERLIICREAAKLGQAEAARKIKITQQSLGGLESGSSRQPASDTLLDMRDKLGYDPDYVIRGRGMPLLPNFEELAQEQALILIYRELREDVRPEALRSIRALRRAQGGGASSNDPFRRDPPSAAGEDD